MNTQTNVRSGTANARFKASFGRHLWGGILVAVMLHFAFFQFFPRLTAADFSYEPDWIHVLQPPELDIPPPPDPIARPKVPIVGPTDFTEDITIPKTDFRSNPIETLPPPPSDAVGPEGRFTTPYTVRPELKDAAGAIGIVEKLYPSMLRAAGIGGTVTVQALVDTAGIVRAATVAVSSGNPTLDAAALEAVRQFEFTPAWNRDTKVAVQIMQAITFKVR